MFSVGAALACKKRKIPYVLTVDADLLLEKAVSGTPLKGVHATAAAWSAKLTYKLADRIICVSSPAKEHLINEWAVDSEKIYVLPNGVDVSRFAQLKKETQVTRKEFGLDGKPVVMFVGGFQHWHGIDLLVRSFEYVLEKIPEAQLLLVGDGPVRLNIEHEIKQKQLENSVSLTGMIPHGLIPEMLSIADVVVIPYPQLPKELWFSPLKLYEYMAAGKAIVASNSGQIADVIHHGQNGLLIEPGDVVAQADAITSLLLDRNERDRLGQNARQQAIIKHSWKQYTHCLQEVYQSVL